MKSEPRTQYPEWPKPVWFQGTHELGIIAWRAILDLEDPRRISEWVASHGGGKLGDWSTNSMGLTARWDDQYHAYVCCMLTAEQYIIVLSGGSPWGQNTFPRWGKS